MIEIKGLGPAGTMAFVEWIESKGSLSFPMSAVEADSHVPAELQGIMIDNSRSFQNRYEWGIYLAEALGAIEPSYLHSQKADPVWGWLCFVWISQLTKNLTKILKPENYIVSREGYMQRRIHRNAARTTYMLAKAHGECSRIILDRPMHVRGELTENLSATKAYMTHTGFFKLAHSLYIGENGKPLRGAMSKPKKKEDWTPGNRAGLGSVRRLITFLDRLYYTFDTMAMSEEDMLARLPVEFSKFTSKRQHGPVGIPVADDTQHFQSA